MDKRTILAVISIVLGVALTWVTGQFSSPFAVIQIDVVQYGALLPWMNRVIPTHFTNYIPRNLVVDGIARAEH